MPRSTFYHVPKEVSDGELKLMELMDRCHLEHPYYGSRRIRDWLGDRGHKELLGLWISEHEGAKFWLGVLTELQNRGVKDVVIA